MVDDPKSETILTSRMRHGAQELDTRLRSLPLIFGLIQEACSLAYHRDIRTGRLRALKGQPLDRSPGQGTFIGYHITRRHINLPKGMNEIAERSRHLVRSPIGNRVGICVGKSSADFPFFDHTVVDKSESAGEQFWRATCPEKMVGGEELLFRFHSCRVSLEVREVFPIKAALVTGKGPRFSVKQSQICST